jgi:hypothetical protein
VLRILSVSLIAGAHPLAGKAATETSVVAFVDGTPIAAAELKLQMLNDRPAVFQYFHATYNVDDNPVFWTSYYGKENPLTWLKQRAMQDIVRIRVQEILMKRYGLIRDAGYSYFETAFNAENSRRRHALANNQPVYGVLQYSESQYLDYVITNGANHLKDAMAGHELPLDTIHLKHYYDAAKATRYTINGSCLPYAQALPNVKIDYLTDAYKDYIDRQCKKARITIIGRPFDAIQAF